MGRSKRNHRWRRLGGQRRPAGLLSDVGIERVDPPGIERDARPPEKIGKEPKALPGEDLLGMKLHSVKGGGLVGDAHDRAGVIAGNDGEVGR